MIATDRDALVCDMAETYGIYDMRGLPVSTLATLAVGLRDNARIKMKLLGQRVPQETLLQAMAVDALNFLAWAKTEPAQRGEKRPASVVDILLGQNKTEQTKSFASGEDFMSEWQRLTGGN